MIVTEMIPVDKRRSKVVLDEDFTLVLYRGEIKRFHIEEGGSLSDEAYDEILNDILLKRARGRVLHLLKSSDKTEQELRRKLKEGFYPQEAIESAISFLKRNHFIDDRNYADRYVEFHSEHKSRKQIQYELKKKGIDQELIREVLEDRPIDEEEQIRSYIRKKRLRPDEMSRAERQKVMAALGRKGFSYEAVSRILGSIYCDD